MSVPALALAFRSANLFKSANGFLTMKLNKNVFFYMIVHQLTNLTREPYLARQDVLDMVINIFFFQRRWQLKNTLIVRPCIFAVLNHGFGSD
jgi:pyrroloquinoline quinone (PQQ) biosynthesis protein C